MVQSFKEWLIPGSLPFLLLACSLAAVSAIFAARRGRRLLLTAIGIVLGMYWLFSVPAVANALMSGYPPIERMSLRGAPGPRAAIVVIGCGIWTYRSGGEEIETPNAQTAFNVLRGSQLYRAWGEPAIIATGGVADSAVQRVPEADVLVRLLKERGVRDDRLIVERRSHTTREQAANVAALANEHGLSPLVIVTSPVHLRRTLRVFRAEGVEAYGEPASFASERRRPLVAWLPTPEAADIAASAMYDYIGWVYYWSRGWFSANAAPLR